MINSSTTLALPWGVVDNKPFIDQGAAAGLRPRPRLTLEDVELKLNDKIEVEWHVTPGDGKEPFDRWWRATVIGPIAGSTSGAEAGGDEASQPSEPAQPSYEILYDPYDSFEEERATVRFVSKRRLFDTEQVCEMMWRKEGAETAPAGDGSSEEDECDEEIVDDDDAPAGDHTVTVGEFEAACEREGTSNDDALAAVLATMAPEKQRIMAEGFLDFKKRLSDFMATAMERKRGTELQDTITADDVHEFTRKLQGDTKRRHI